MSDFGAHEPQPMNEGNGDANNHTSESLDHVMPVRTHTFTEHRTPRQTWPSGRTAKRPHAQRSATCAAPHQPILCPRHRADFSCLRPLFRHRACFSST